jgi:hypothetical protein
MVWIMVSSPGGFRQIPVQTFSRLLKNAFFPHPVKTAIQKGLRTPGFRFRRNDDQSA